jgi:hypothetical protein
MLKQIVCTLGYCVRTVCVTRRHVPVPMIMCTPPTKQKVEDRIPTGLVYFCGKNLSDTWALYSYSYLLKIATNMKYGQLTCAICVRLFIKSRFPSQIAKMCTKRSCIMRFQNKMATFATPSTAGTSLTSSAVCV